ncbi:MAG TPA: hypothetical protein VEZ11_00875 [Thermoanaerobaculia bacterium]|nr:hypothetical protein [Thermoanaerobaculia bacterium]
MHEFAMAVRDELWARGDARSPSDVRVGSGIARDDGRTIVASDRIGDRALRDELSGHCETQMSALVPTIRAADDASVRAVVRARWVRAGDREASDASASLSITIPYAARSLSIVTDAANAVGDLKRLRELARTEPEGQAVDYRSLPILWLDGSGAVLLHEAAGHAAEHDHPPVSWPHWLSVLDEPGEFIDDTGAAATSADLLAGVAPSARRRETFRDVALRRMSNLIAAHDDAPCEVPSNRIEVHLLVGGSYEPLDEMVSLFVIVADLVARDRSRRLPPFVIRETRAAIAAALTGAGGSPVRYPGVACSREGQDLVVGSSAPNLLTAGFAR